MGYHKIHILYLATNADSRSDRAKPNVRKKPDRSILRGESIGLFRAAIRSPSTRDPYERRLIGF
jgi:hypothetical protein